MIQVEIEIFGPRNRGWVEIYAPCCQAVNIRESQRTPSPQLWECEFHLHTWPKWGCDMYAMVCTRPDISHVVGVVSRYMSNLGKQHWEAVKWILMYLRGTTEKCLSFRKDELKLEGYVDSDFAREADQRRSTIGYVFTLGSTAISWVSQL